MKCISSILPFFLCVCFSVLVVSSPCAYAAADGTVPYDASEQEPGDEGPTENTGMLDTTAELGKTLISAIWSLFGIYVPGFSFTFGQMWLGVLLCSISITVIHMIFGFGGGSGGVSSRTSSTNNPRISKERRHDEF